jgi:phosphoribosylaminoimidazole-succinocarboxamide synthase
MKGIKILMSITKLNQIYEGKAKKVFATDNPEYYIVEYKDDATAFNGLKKGTISGKGVINNRMSNIMFRLMEKKGIHTHFVEELSDRETVVRAVKIVPLEIIIRNVAAGSFSKRYGVEEGRELLRPTLEFSLKDDALNDPLINDSHIVALGVATESELESIRNMAFKVNDVMKEFFAGIGIKLIDFKIEAGRLPNGEIVLADEISPDTCRFWDAKTNEKLDKDRFRRDLGNVEEAYQEIFKRINQNNNA